MKAFVLINIRTGSIHEVVGFLKRIKNVREAYATFGPYDALAVIEAADLETIGEIVYKEIQAIPGVQETLTCLSVDVGD